MRFFGGEPFDERSDNKKVVLAFQMRINEECLPSLTTNTRGPGSYMGDVHECVGHEAFNHPRGHWWGGMNVETQCMRQFAKTFIDEVNRSAIKQGLSLPPCKFKNNIHVSVPAFKKAGCTWVPLMGTLDQGMNSLHVQQMAAWKAITYDVLHPRVQHDGALEGENSHRDKMYRESLTSKELPPGSYAFDRSVGRACREENDAERAARDKTCRCWCPEHDRNSDAPRNYPPPYVDHRYCKVCAVVKEFYIVNGKKVIIVEGYPVPGFFYAQQPMAS